LQIRRFQLPSPLYARSKAGQSLAEFVLVLPVLFLAAVVGGGMVVGAHQAHVAAMAVDQIALHKLQMAANDGAVGPEVLSTYANSGDMKSPFLGSLVDSMTVSSLDPYTDVAVGSKQFIPTLTKFVPGFTVKTGQVINHNLLQSASNGIATQHSTAPWVPGGTPLAPPWGG
jgi:hypothetical protein